MKADNTENIGNASMYRQVFDRCSAPIAIFDTASLDLLYRNQAFDRIAPSLSASADMKSILSMFLPDDRADEFEISLKRSGTAASSSFRLDTSAISYDTCVFSAYTLQSTETSRPAFVLQCVVSTERVTDDSARSYRLFMLDELIDKLPYSIAVFDADGFFRRGNDGFRNMFAHGVPDESYSIFQDEFFRERYHDEIQKLRDGHLARIPSMIVRPEDNALFSGGVDRDFSLSLSFFPLCSDYGALELVVTLFEDITQRKNYEQRIKQRLASEKVIFDSVPISIWKYDFSGALPMKEEIERAGIRDVKQYLDQNPDILKQMILSLRVVDVNRETLKLYGAKTREDIVGSLGHYLSQDVIDTYTAIITAYLSGEKIIECETTNRTIDGRLIDILLRVTFPERCSASNIALSTVTDITELKRIEKAYRDSEERYRVMFDAVPVAVFEYDFSEAMSFLEGLDFSVEDPGLFFDAHRDLLVAVIEKVRLINVNNEALRLYRAGDKDDFLREFGHRHTPESFRTFHKAIVSYLNGIKSFTTETVNEAFDGTRLELFYRITFPTDERLESRALVSVVDITKRKEAEQRLANTLKRFKVMAEYSPNPISVLSSDGAYLYINSTFTEVFGYHLESIPPDSELIGATLSTKENRRETDDIGIENRTVFINCHDGSGREVILHSVCLDDGTEYRTYEDITERKRMEDERLKVSKLDSLGILAGGIAHDFNNIMTAVMGNISLAKRFVDSEDAIFQLLDKSESACDRAKNLTKQLLAFSRGGAPVRETSSIGDIIRESASFALIGSNVRCEFDISESLHRVRVDKDQFSQVINNIIINADQAMPDGGLITVSAVNGFLKTDSAVPCVNITIRDAGEGISPDILPKIFDPYFTTKDNGRGLGLASAYAIIKRHDGSIEVSSLPGRGSAFIITLPAEIETDTEETCDSGDHEREETRKASVLVMDDEPEIRALLKDMLEFSGHSFTGAEDGAKAIDLYKKALEDGTPFDIVIMDLTVPGGLGGKETVQELLAIDPDVTAVVSSGYSNDPVLAEYESYGFKAVMTKPYRLKEITSLMSRLLRS